MQNKVKKFFINNLSLILSIVFILTYSYILYFNIKYKLKDLNINSNGYYIYFFIILFLLLIILNFIYFKKINKLNDNTNDSIDIYNKMYFLFVVFFGVFYLVLSPFFTGSDEHNHFYRIYEITEGKLVTPTNEYVGSRMPSSLKDTFVAGGGKNGILKYRNVKDMIKVKYNKSDLLQYGAEWVTDYSNTALYSPVQYFPHIIGVSIGKILKLNVYYIGMLGRLFNFICYAALGFLAIKTMPKFKLFYLVILLSPSMIQSATTLSADAFTSIIFLLIIALIYKIKNEKKMINKKTLSLLGFLCLIISLCKIVYFPVVFLLLLIPTNCFKYGKKEKCIYSILLILLSCFLSLYWMTFTDGVFKIAYDMNSAQKTFIFQNILEYLAIFLRTISNYFSEFTESLFVGTRMYHSQLKMPSLVSWLYVFIVGVALFVAKEKNNFKVFEKIFVALIGMIIMGLISTAIYVQCTAQFFSVGNITIEGIQGRYFIPVVMLLPFMIREKVNLNISACSVMCSVIAINIVTILYIFVQFI